MRKKRQGFTLIELLAVIVILGLLMAIAIPSVTKYITQSRKKTVTTSIGNYIGALTNQVNDMEYVFTGTNTIYAVPIECIALERGGTDPFGEWLHANRKYWAYVLVQYDDKTSSYTYGFTFKDSAGYGLYPTTIEKLSESGSQIQQDLILTKPTNGTITNITAKSNWTGFAVDDDTTLHVLEAAADGETGDGVDTCTLCQKGKNYESVEQEKEEDNIPEEELPMLVNLGTLNVEGMSSVQNIIFETSINIPNDAILSMDLSSTGNGKVMGYVNSSYDLYIQGDGKIYTNYDSSNMFSKFTSVKEIKNIELLNTSKTTNMSYMFASMQNLKSLNLSGFDTSKVTNMDSMFYNTGYNTTTFTLDLGNKFDTRNVTNMQRMFYSTGRESTVMTLNLGDKFDTSKVTNMYGMFENTGYESTVFTLDLGDKFDTSKVTNMRAMFWSTGHESTVMTLDLGDKFDTSNVTNMLGMFAGAGLKSTVMTLDLGDKFDTSKVTDMTRMFDGLGYSSSVFTLDLGDKFNTSKVTEMYAMFGNTGYSNTNFTLDLGDKFDTSNVTIMGYMFSGTGKSSKVFSLDLGDRFDTSKVTHMSAMFQSSGYSNVNFTLDLGSKFNTSNVTNMESMFNQTGYNSTVFTLDLGDKFDTSKVTNMQMMFYRTGYAGTWTLDCSNWNVDKVTKYTSFNLGSESKVTPPIWVN